LEFTMIPFALGMLSAPEMGVVLVLVLIVFGAGKLPQVFGQLGKGLKAFKDAQRDEALDATPDPKRLKGADVSDADEV